VSTQSDAPPDPSHVSNAQSAEHTPLAQSCPDGHTVLQLPQRFGSLTTLAHAPPQSISPWAHWIWHFPSTQVRPVSQRVSHDPQCNGSDIVSTHWSPHATCPRAQPGAVAVDPAASVEGAPAAPTSTGSPPITPVQPARITPRKAPAATLQDTTAVPNRTPQRNAWAR
jgi:hypothetical protein